MDLLLGRKYEIAHPDQKEISLALARHLKPVCCSGAPGRTRHRVVNRERTAAPHQTDFNGETAPHQAVDFSSSSLIQWSIPV